MVPKLFSSKSFKLTLPARRRQKQGSSSPPVTPPSPAQPGCSRTGQYLEVFRHFDSDEDGKISSQELRHFLASKGEHMPLSLAEAIIADFDSDGDGSLEYNDFVRLLRETGGGDSGAVCHEEPGREEEDIKGAFEMYEEEKGSGCITPKSLKRALNWLGDDRSDEECEAMIRSYDLDGNGVIDFHEFRLMMA